MTCDRFKGLGALRACKEMTPCDECVKVLYRYDVVTYAPPVDEFDNICGPSRHCLVLRTYRVLRHTPKGTRLVDGRFVLRGARKKFACRTKEEARESLIARKKAQVRILQAQLDHAKVCLAMAENGRTDEIFECVSLEEFL